jgi:hypothetical protein
MCRLWSSGWCFPFLFPFSHLDGWSMMILYSYYIKFEINDKPLSLARSSAFSAPISSYNIDIYIDNIAWISMWSLNNFILTLLPFLFHRQVEQPHTWGMWVATQVSQSHSSARWFFWSDVGRSWTSPGQWCGAALEVSFRQSHGLHSCDVAVHLCALYGYEEAFLFELTQEIKGTPRRSS